MAIESALGFDEYLVLDMASTPPLPPIDQAAVARSELNLGVAAGRNRLARQANSEILVFLDDDARFVSTDHADAIRRWFARDPNLAVLAFRVVRPDGSMRALEYPYRGTVPSTLTVGQCAYFVGCAVAIRRDAFLAAGGFDERYQYSTEELDLSFALLRDGWSLWFDPAIVVEHRPSSRGRTTPAETVGLRIRNRLLVVRRHLPWPVAIGHAFVWAARTFVEGIHARSLSQWMRGVRAGIRLPVLRKPISWSRLPRIHGLGGRVLW